MAEREVVRDILLPESGFWNGVARLFDFSGSLDRAAIERIRARYKDPPPIPSTEEAIRATWESVGESMRWAIGEYDKTLRENDTVADEQTRDTERLTSTGKADPMAAPRSVDADETRVRSALRSADANLRRALARYNLILGEPETK